MLGLQFLPDGVSILTPSSTPAVAAVEPKRDDQSPECAGPSVSRSGNALKRGTDAYDAGNRAEAARVFCWLARAGDATAALYLGAQYEFAHGIPRDYRMAVYWYERAAKQGNAVAQSNLGSMYESGRGVAEDWMSAAAWYTRSAEAGDAQGQYRLARAFEFGIGVPQNRNQALAWYSKAAKQGYQDAMMAARHLKVDNLATAFRTPEERQIVGFQHYRPPVGIAFRNSRERVAYLRGEAVYNSRWAAWNRYDTQRSEYERCSREAGRSCYQPSPPSFSRP